MPIIQSIVLNDGSAPVTYLPKGRVGNVSSFITSTGVPRVQESTLKCSLIENTLSQRVIVKLERPLTHLDGSLVVIDDNVIGEINVRFPVGMTDASRLTFIEEMKSSFSDALLLKVLKEGESIWG